MHRILLVLAAVALIHPALAQRTLDRALSDPAIGFGGARGGWRGFSDQWAHVPQMMRTANVIVLLAGTIGAK